MKLSYEPNLAGIDSAFIGIHGFLPMAVEFGSDSFDMKNRLHGGANSQGAKPRAPIKIGKNGIRYTIIPMRHGTQGSAKDRRMHVPPPAFQKLMHKKRIGHIIRGTTGPHTTSKATVYRSAVPRYEGMTKMETKGRSTGWHTFRTMSETSQRQSWIHLGFKAYMLHERVIDHIDNTLVPELIGPLFDLIGNIK